jgi:hypothetical protein
MAMAHAELDSPGIWRNDRFWLAGDHIVHPTIMKHPNIAALVNEAEKAKKDFKMTEYQGMNYAIMYTEFVRERAEPGIRVLRQGQRRPESRRCGESLRCGPLQEVAVSALKGSMSPKILPLERRFLISLEVRECKR